MSEGLVLSDLCLACDAPWAKGEPGLVGWSRDLRRTTGTSQCELADAEHTVVISVPKKGNALEGKVIG